MPRLSSSAVRLGSVVIVGLQLAVSYALPLAQKKTMHVLHAAILVLLYGHGPDPVMRLRVHMGVSENRGP